MSSKYASYQRLLNQLLMCPRIATFAVTVYGVSGAAPAAAAARVSADDTAAAVADSSVAVVKRKVMIE